MNLFHELPPQRRGSSKRGQTGWRVRARRSPVDLGRPLHRTVCSYIMPLVMDRYSFLPIMFVGPSTCDVCWTCHMFDGMAFGRLKSIGLARIPFGKLQTSGRSVEEKYPPCDKEKGWARENSSCFRSGSCGWISPHVNRSPDRALRQEALGRYPKSLSIPLRLIHSRRTTGSRRQSGSPVVVRGSVLEV